MADFCNCDQRGSCGEYNSSRFSGSEILYHKKWDELYDPNIREFRSNITVCYCDAGWTGYSDMGTFHVGLLRNCAISQEAMRVLWTISSICHAILIVGMIHRGLQQTATEKWTQSNSRTTVRLAATVLFFSITIAKLVHINEPWLVTIGVSPTITVVYMFGILCFTLNIAQTQHRQANRYFSKLFKDFGFGDRVKLEQVHIVLSVRIQQACIVVSVIFYTVAVNFGNSTTRNTAVIVYFGVLLIILLGDVLIVDPKTNARFVIILKRMMDVNTAGSQYQAIKQLAGSQNKNSPPGIVRMNSANVTANARLQEVYAKVAVMNRTKRVQTLLYALSCIPFYKMSWWKYLGYNIVLSTILYSFAKTIIFFLSLRRRSRRRREETKSRVANRANSSEVSAFKSSTVSVAPLVSRAQSTSQKSHHGDEVKSVT